MAMAKYAAYEYGKIPHMLNTFLTFFVFLDFEAGGVLSSCNLLQYYVKFYLRLKSSDLPLSSKLIPVTQKLLRVRDLSTIPHCNKT